MKVTWLGEEGSANVTETLGHRFYKGKAVDIPDNDPNRMKFVNNPAFHTDAKEESERLRAAESAAKAEAEVQKAEEAEAVRLAKEAEAKAKAEADAKLKAALAARPKV